MNLNGLDFGRFRESVPVRTVSSEPQMETGTSTKIVLLTFQAPRGTQMVAPACPPQTVDTRTAAIAARSATVMSAPGVSLDANAVIGSTEPNFSLPTASIVTPCCKTSRAQLSAA
ncbi:hypothetical protein MTE01_20360 [Microbacterium testaceum]|uniref:Uncharacterized protein n=1 Tax=Microbacterium testaceum TaxID=2033 RepID=A0A4Y3QLW2_MICTE|nr:hypothetical protein [Microbacterium testaceum]GEB46091.1 hypothetical protein MTE01_20360 [Microbacterium testaceum]